MILFRPSRSRHIQTRGVQESSREPSKRQSEVPEALRGKLQMHFDSSTRVNLLVDLIKPSAESIPLSQSGPRAYGAFFEKSTFFPQALARRFLWYLRIAKRSFRPGICVKYFSHFIKCYFSIFE